MSNDQILEKLRTIICKHVSVQPDDITLEKAFIDDLGADSLEFVEVVIDLEEAFDVKIPDMRAQNIVHVRDAIACIAELVRSQDSSGWGDPERKLLEIKDPNVRAVFEMCPQDVQERLLFLRDLILETAASTEGVGQLEEVVRWGDPSYLTTASKSGSIIRINARGRVRGACVVYFHCQTSLVDSFRMLYPDLFRFEGNRAIVFYEAETVPVEALRHCVAMALTYNLRNASQGAAPWTGDLQHGTKERPC